LPAYASAKPRNPETPLAHRKCGCRETEPASRPAFSALPERLTIDQVSDTLVTDGKSYRIDASRWPVVVVTRLCEPTDAQLKDSLAALDRLVDARPEKYSLVLDLRRAPTPTPPQRKLLAEHALERAVQTRRYCRGEALVLDSPLIRGLLAASLWLKKRDVPTHAFAELEPALEWAGMLHVESVLAGRISLRP
jgi:hypothetical protein